MMVIFDKPYVSKFMYETIERLKIPALKNEASEELKLPENINFMEDKEIIELLKKSGDGIVYTNSENSINWVINNLSFTDIPDKINLFKDKFKFRKLMKEHFPNFYFKKVSLTELDKIDIKSLKLPFVIKPNIGFFSIAVYRVDNENDWKNVVRKIKESIENYKDVFPIEVVNATDFIIEQYIDGEEFAVDAYFNKNGNPVILNILKHEFASEEDMSDRLYYTSKKIVQTNYDIFFNALQHIGSATGVKNFPVHVEMRLKPGEEPGIIEVNPLRFAGYCIADLAYYAYGINSYEYFFKQIQPEWNSILQNNSGNIFAMIVGNLPSDIRLNSIDRIDLDKFKQRFSNILEFRPINFRKYPLFAIVFDEVDKEHKSELEQALKMDLREFVILKK